MFRMQGVMVALEAKGTIQNHIQHETANETGTL